MIIREETPSDITRITELTAAAFAAVPYSDGSEPHIINALRKAGDLTLSLVAEKDGQVLGQVTFSPVTIETAHDQWFGLGPVSVDPAHQGKGIGADLIREGLSQMRARGAKGCVLVGDPNYYQRFGFKGDSGLSYAGLEPRFVQQLRFEGGLKSGAVEYAPAFLDH